MCGFFFIAFFAESRRCLRPSTSSSPSSPNVPNCTEHIGPLSDQYVPPIPSGTVQYCKTLSSTL
ncbi:hypothetical protein BHE74_00031150, partial [Ensete ventricosum]